MKTLSATTIPTLAIGGIAFACLFLLGLSNTPSEEFDFSNNSIPLDQIFSGGPSKDGIPAILDPVFIQATKATFLNDQDRFLGLLEGNKTKAYPIKILNWHEIVNNLLSGKPVVVTYCPLCATGIGFDPVVGKRHLTFGGLWSFVPE
ncbi:DUF3179 domain-containing (seleno)protein [Nitrospira sp. M1]